MNAALDIDRELLTNHDGHCARSFWHSRQCNCANRPLSFVGIDLTGAGMWNEVLGR
jgi:hypothetical protein